MPGPKPPHNFLTVWETAMNDTIAAQEILGAKRKGYFQHKHLLACPVTLVWSEGICGTLCHVYICAVAPHSGSCTQHDVPHYDKLPALNSPKYPVRNPKGQPLRHSHLLLWVSGTGVIDS